MKTVFIADKVAADCVTILQQSGFNVINKPGLEVSEKLEILAEADALIVRSATEVDAEMFAASPNLKVVGRAGTGVDKDDHLDAALPLGEQVVEPLLAQQGEPHPQQRDRRGDDGRECQRGVTTKTVECFAKCVSEA